jgi:hypothetical protein
MGTGGKFPNHLPETVAEFEHWSSGVANRSVCAGLFEGKLENS